MPLNEEEKRKAYYGFGFFTKIKLSLTKPDELFESTADESLGSTIKFALLLIVFYSVLAFASMLVSIFLFSGLLGGLAGMIGLSSSLFATLFTADKLLLIFAILLGLQLLSFSFTQESCMRL
jgi:hypothetical protein